MSHGKIDLKAGKKILCNFAGRKQWKKKKRKVKSYSTDWEEWDQFWHTFLKKHYVRMENNCLENTVRVVISCMSRKIVLLGVNYCFHLVLWKSPGICADLCTQSQHDGWEDIPSSQKWIMQADISSWVCWARGCGHQQTWSSPLA